MAQKTQLKTYQVEAVYQIHGGHIREVSFEVEAANGQDLWEHLTKDADQNQMWLMSAKVREVNTATGEAVTVRPLEDKSDTATVYALPPPANAGKPWLDDEDGKNDESLVRTSKAWYEWDEHFEYAWEHVYAVRTLEVEEDEDNDTATG